MAEKRTKTVAVRLDESEWWALKAAAGLSGRAQLGRWLRETALTVAAGQSPRRPLDVARDRELGQLRSELIRVGNNLNQAQRYAYRHPDEEPRLTAAVAECGRQLSRLADELEADEQ